MKKLFLISLIYIMLFSISWGQISSTHQLDLKKTSDLDSSIVLTAPDNTQVTILRDSFGVPHITAETETGIFYGQGYAVAQDRLFQMETNIRAAEGRLAEWFGSSYLQADKVRLTIFYRDSEEVQLFANLPVELQNMYSAYSAGVNSYIDSVDVNPEKFKPYEFTRPGFEIERWSKYKSFAVSQYLAFRFGHSGPDELDRLKELQDHGWDWFNKNRPINDSTAPTTIPYGVLPPPQKYHYSGMTVRPKVIDAIDKERVQIDSKLKSIGIPLKWGSFAAVINPSKSSTGNVMLLGCPQMMDTIDKDQPNIANEVELQCPSFHVGGITVAGMPMIFIGHNDYCAWTITSGNSDNEDVYIDSTHDASFSSYWYKGQWLPFESFIDTINITGARPEIFKHYRTIHGPLFDADLQNHQTFSVKKTFWKEESGTIQCIYNEMKAGSLSEFEAAIAMNTLSYNVFYIDKDQNVNYWHSGKYQDRTDGVDPRLPHKGDGSEEWGGFIPFSDLPAIHNPVQGYLINWNNKPVSWWNQGDNMPWCPADTILYPGSHNSYNSVLRINKYVAPLDSFNYSNLENIPYAIQDHGSYQEAIEMSSSEIKDENILPPGQSGFIDINGVKNPHFDDQWTIFTNWQFKDQIFSSSLVGLKENSFTTPESYKLFQNYPNPFNPTTTIKYSITKQSLVTLKIYDILGSQVATLINEEKPAGNYEVNFNASNLASGVYFYRINAGTFIQTKKMILLR